MLCSQMNSGRVMSLSRCRAQWLSLHGAAAGLGRQSCSWRIGKKHLPRYGALRAVDARSALRSSSPGLSACSAGPSAPRSRAETCNQNRRQAIGFGAIGVLSTYLPDLSSPCLWTGRHPVESAKRIGGGDIRGSGNSAVRESMRPIRYEAQSTMRLCSPVTEKAIAQLRQNFRWPRSWTPRVASNRGSRIPVGIGRTCSSAEVPGRVSA
jgi:hypothetical protein